MIVIKLIKLSGGFKNIIFLSINYLAGSFILTSASQLSKEPLKGGNIYKVEAFSVFQAALRGENYHGR